MPKKKNNLNIFYYFISSYVKMKVFTYSAVGLSDVSNGSHPNFGFVFKYFKINKLKKLQVLLCYIENS